MSLHEISLSRPTQLEFKEARPWHIKIISELYECRHIVNSDIRFRQHCSILRGHWRCRTEQCKSYAGRYHSSQYRTTERDGQWNSVLANDGVVYSDREGLDGTCHDKDGKGHLRANRARKKHFFCHNFSLTSMHYFLAVELYSVPVSLKPYKVCW